VNPPAATASDEILLTRACDGDETAFAALWTRHSDTGRRVATAVSRTFDADDLVAEAYVRIYEALRAGHGPRRAFTPYLIVTIKNIAASWIRKAREVPTEVLDTVPDWRSFEDPVLAASDQAMAVSAFQALPARWQEILWYTEVEQMTPVELSSLLGMSPNSVSALTHRAREGLREQWINQHSRAQNLPADCRHIADLMGGYVRGRLTDRKRAKVDVHLDSCERCASAAREAADVESRLTTWFGPLLAFAQTLPALMRELGQGATTAATVATGAAGGVGAAHVAGHGVAAVVTSKAALVGVPAVIAAIAATVILTQGGASAPEPVEELAAPVVATTPAPITTRALPPPPPPAPSPVAATYSPTPTPSVEEPTPTPIPIPEPPPEAAPVTIQSVDTGSGEFEGALLPILAGIAEPGATLAVTNGSLGEITVVADDAGHWITPVLSGLAVGSTVVEVTDLTHLQRATVDVDLQSPHVRVAPGPGAFTVRVKGTPSALIELYADGELAFGPEALDAKGAWSATFTWNAPGHHEVAARIVADGRVGPLTVAEFDALPA